MLWQYAIVFAIVPVSLALAGMVYEAWRDRNE